MGGGDLFDGVEGVDEAQQTSGAGGDPGAGADDQDDPMGGLGLAEDDDAIGESIVDGAARLAVIGLDDDELDDGSVDDLQDELRETFEAFQLGTFGSAAAEKYVLEPADGEVDPAWGLFGSALMAMGMTLYLRPDGAEKVAAVRKRVERLAGGGGEPGE
jgi:hypothetical protein